MKMWMLHYALSKLPWYLRHGSLKIWYCIFFANLYGTVWIEKEGKKR